MSKKKNEKVINITEETAPETAVAEATEAETPVEEIAEEPKKISWKLIVVAGTIIAGVTAFAIGLFNAMRSENDYEGYEENSEEDGDEVADEEDGASEEMD